MTIDDLLTNWRKVMQQPATIRTSTPSTIAFDIEEFGTDVCGNPSESINLDLMRRVKEARDIAEAGKIVA